MSGLQGWGSWYTGRELWQAVSNERPIPRLACQHVAPMPIPVRARIAWELDGPETIETVAIGWTGRDVLVEVLDPRRRIHGV